MQRLVKKKMGDCKFILQSVLLIIASSKLFMLLKLSRIIPQNFCVDLDHPESGPVPVGVLVFMGP